MPGAPPAAGKKWTSKKGRQAFLAALSGSGNVGDACRTAGVNPSTMYTWRHKDEKFAKQWEEALDNAIETLELEAWRRAKDGVDEPVGFFQGQWGGTSVRKYSDTLLIFLLKANRRKKYDPEGYVRIETFEKMQEDVHALREQVTELAGAKGDGASS